MTRIQVLGADGGADTTGSAGSILTLLAEQLRCPPKGASGLRLAAGAFKASDPDSLVEVLRGFSSFGPLAFRD